jgi:hypothetical protein
MHKREANFGKQFRAWMRSQDLPSAAFELKQTTSNSIAFNALQEHQEFALLASKSPTGLLYKAPDDSRGVKPFDFFYLKESLAFVVVRYPKGFVVIAIEDWIDERNRSERKSLTYERAVDISTFSV